MPRKKLKKGTLTGARESWGAVPKFVLLFRDLARTRLREAGWSDALIKQVEDGELQTPDSPVPKRLSRLGALSVRNARETLMATSHFTTAWEQRDPVRISSNAIAIGVTMATSETLLRESKCRVGGGKKGRAAAGDKTDIFVDVAKVALERAPKRSYKYSVKEIHELGEKAESWGKSVPALSTFYRAWRERLSHTSSDRKRL